MSGIAAVIRTDGAPIPAALIERVTASMVNRGPDRQATHSIGQAALGHALLGNDGASAPDIQPLTVDRNTWIVADARLDDRSALMRALELVARTGERPPTDAELILRAFMKWGEGCVDHLAGDFAFAIWSADARRLFSARDHFGIKPLYYADIGPWIVLGSAIECIRLHTAVSDTLDDIAVADFLLFGHKADAAATTFRDVRRLPPAHILTWSTEAGCRVRRYWELPYDEPCYRRDEEYASELRELLDQSMSDRLRTDRVGMFFSGGLDSAILAATAVRRITSSAVDPVRAFSFVYSSLIEDDERDYAAAAAAHLGIPYQHYVVDESRGWKDDMPPDTPEPHLNVPHGDVSARCYADMARHSRVALYGEGPDNALTYEWRPYLGYLRRTRQWGRLASDAFAFIKHQRRLPHIPRLVSAAPPAGNATSSPDFPTWMSHSLIQRLDLAERWRRIMREPHSAHPARPAAWFSFQLPLWGDLFESLDPVYTGVPLEIRHPYLDLRVIRFLMSVPVIPWCRDKYLFRFAFRQDLPAAIVRRSKAPLQGNPEQRKMRRDGLPAIVRSPRLEIYARCDVPVADECSTASEGILRLAALSRWLCRLDSTRSAAAPR